MPTETINSLASRWGLMFKIDIAGPDDLVIMLSVNGDERLGTIDEVNSDKIIEFDYPAENVGVVIRKGDDDVYRQVHQPQKTDQEGVYSIDLSLSLNDLILPKKTSIPPAVRFQKKLTVSGRFVSIHDSCVSFKGCKLFVIPVTTDAHREEIFPASSQRNFVNGEVDDIYPLFTSGVMGTLEAGGSFQFVLPIEDTIKGWAWLIVGNRSFAGFIVDDASKSVSNVNILLNINHEEDREVRGGEEEKCDCSSKDFIKTALGVSEKEILENPEYFSDDPGSSCEPFEKPNRVLGEKSFHTILRITPPRISNEFELSPEMKKEITLGIGAIAETVPVDSSYGADIRESIYTAVKEIAKKVIKSLTPDPDGFMRNKIVNVSAIDWESEKPKYQAATLAYGHILDWKIRWKSNGYSLGDISHTLTLAPRQAKRISKVTWSRKERNSRSEIQRYSDSLDQSTSHSRDYQNAVSASLSEWSNGASQSAMAATAVAGGAVGPGFVVGASAVASVSVSGSQSSGGRETAAQENQQLRDSIRQFAESMRQQESTIIQEVSQEESVEGVTEVIRNPNYGHSLSIVYYQILRHLKVDTDLACVRECVFVPLEIKEFDKKRILRWQDILMRSLLKPKMIEAFEYFEDFASDSSLPAVLVGMRADRKIRYIEGNIELRIGINKPKDRDDRRDWTRLSKFLSTPHEGIIKSIESLVGGEKEDYFQKEIAPSILKKWVKQFYFPALGEDSESYFSLKSTYKYGGKVRIRFTCSVENSITRKELFEPGLKIAVKAYLPPGSVADITKVDIKYYADDFDYSVVSRPMSDGVIDSAGRSSGESATAKFPLTVWEKVNVKEDIINKCERLEKHLNRHQEYYHKAIWWNMDRDRLYMMLDGFTLEDGKTSIASVVQRDPITIVGNTIVFAVANGASVNSDALTTPLQRLESYNNETTPDSMLISLPTGGVYARALMDKCLALEEHRGDVDWVLDQPDLELDDLSGHLGSRAQPVPGLASSGFAESLIDLVDPQQAPSPAGVSDVLNAVTKNNAFRDMAGLAGTQANAMGALKEAASLAKEFGSKAVDVYKADLATQLANRKLDSTQKARDKGLITQKQAEEVSKQTLDEMNVPKNNQELVDKPTISSVIRQASENNADLEIISNSNGESIKIRKNKTSPVKSPKDIEVTDVQKTIWDARKDAVILFKMKFEGFSSESKLFEDIGHSKGDISKMTAKKLNQLVSNYWNKRSGLSAREINLLHEEIDRLYLSLMKKEYIKVGEYSGLLEERIPKEKSWNKNGVQGTVWLLLAGLICSGSDKLLWNIQKGIKSVNVYWGKGGGREALQQVLIEAERFERGESTYPGYGQQFRKIVEKLNRFEEDYIRVANLLSPSSTTRGNVLNKIGDELDALESSSADYYLLLDAYNDIMFGPPHFAYCSLDKICRAKELASGHSIDVAYNSLPESLKIIWTKDQYLYLFNHGSWYEDLVKKIFGLFK